MQSIGLLANQDTRAGNGTGENEILPSSGEKKKITTVHAQQALCKPAAKAAQTTY